jgi:F0F1-type ATP synthase membrane subunit b/b'
MKTLIVVVLVVVGGLLLYNYADRGEFTLVPPFMVSASDRQLDDIQRQLDAAKRAFKEAGQTATITATDMTQEVVAARRQAEHLEKELHQKMAKLNATARARAEKLQRAIEAFKRELQ